MAPPRAQSTTGGGVSGKKPTPAPRKSARLQAAENGTDSDTDVQDKPQLLGRPLPIRAQKKKSRARETPKSAEHRPLVAQQALVGQGSGDEAFEHAKSAQPATAETVYVSPCTKSATGVNTEALPSSNLEGESIIPRDSNDHEAQDSGQFAKDKKHSGVLERRDRNNKEQETIREGIDTSEAPISTEPEAEPLLPGPVLVTPKRRSRPSAKGGISAHGSAPELSPSGTEVDSKSLALTGRNGNPQTSRDVGRMHSPVPMADKSMSIAEMAVSTNASAAGTTNESNHLQSLTSVIVAKEPPKTHPLSVTSPPRAAHPAHMASTTTTSRLLPYESTGLSSSDQGLATSNRPSGRAQDSLRAARSGSARQLMPKPHGTPKTPQSLGRGRDGPRLRSPQAKRTSEDEERHVPAVLEYLSKKGYSKSEAMLRMESAAQDADGRPIQTGVEDLTGAKYGSAFALMRDWIEETCLDIYKADLRRLQWPVFVYSFLKLVASFSPRDSRAYFTAFKDSFETEHPDDLRALEPISLVEHLESNETAKIYRNNKYRLRMSSMAFNNLIIFLESKEKEGTRLIVTILQQNLNIVTFERSADNEYSIAKLLDRAKAAEDFPGEDEGIPGHNPGSANTEQAAGSNVLTRLKLGPLPMEPDLMADVRGELEEEDSRNPPAEGQSSLIQHFEQQIKREESEDAPTRTELPLPISTARDVAIEVQKIKENRDRFKIDGRTGGVGPGVSVVMFTFHNTYDGITCLDFSQDNTLVAAGMDQSYIRIWTVSGEALPPIGGSNSTESRPSASRRLIGHSGCVYAVSFSPSASATGASNSAGSSTTSKHLLSCSADKTVRLWSLESWTCLVVYKGHDDIVWDVKWGPFGHYFVTGSHDKTARLWATNDVSFLRIFVGHDKDVDTVCFHPNNAYVFTGSCDKIVRMWKVTDGIPVRMFTGHTGNITSLACSPSGKTLASADDAGTIILWELAPGKLLKRMRGHGKGGIWSLSWSAESTVLVSGGMDGTVRVWDIAVSNDANGQGRVIGEGGTGQKIDGNPQAQASGGGGAKKKGKEVVVTSDQISAFPTKKSPVYKVQFTRQNLVMAGGAYMP